MGGHVYKWVDKVSQHLLANPASPSQTFIFLITSIFLVLKSLFIMLSSAGAFLFLWFFTTPTVFARIHEQLFATPAGWTYLRTPSDNSNIKLQIALAQQNVPEFESKLLAVSTP